MKKIFIVMLIAATLLGSSVTTFGLNSPENKQGHGVFTSMCATEDFGPILGLEYGLTDKFAVLGEGSLGDFKYRKLELKYGMDRTFGLVGGVYNTQYDDKPFIGLNAAIPFTPKFIGILETDGVMVDGLDDIYVLYEAGAKYYLDKSFSIRCGVRGTNRYEDDNAFEVGMGIQF